MALLVGQVGPWGGDGGWFLGGASRCRQGRPCSSLGSDPSRGDGRPDLCCSGASFILSRKTGFPSNFMPPWGTRSDQQGDPGHEGRFKCQQACEGVKVSCDQTDAVRVPGGQGSGRLDGGWAGTHPGRPSCRACGPRPGRARPLWGPPKRSTPTHGLPAAPQNRPGGPGLGLLQPGCSWAQPASLPQHPRAMEHPG